MTCVHVLKHMPRTGKFGRAWVVATVMAVVYEWVGLAFLRRGWINLDLLWVLALITASALLLVTAAL